jgi:hypothetical protein
MILRAALGRRQAITSIVVTAVAIAVGGTPPARAEPRTVPAAASWQARARVFVTGPQQVFLLGAFGGRLTVEREPKALDRAQLVCPAAFDTDYAAKAQRGEGRCIITTGDGDRLFARWTCAGEPDRGCSGRFVLTGGTGAYQGVTGESDFVLRLLLSEILQLDRHEAEYELTGLARWSGLTYRTP